jgi:hypothetical protein
MPLRDLTDRRVYRLFAELYKYESLFPLRHSDTRTFL